MVIFHSYVSLPEGNHVPRTLMDLDGCSKGPLLHKRYPSTCASAGTNWMNWCRMKVALEHLLPIWRFGSVIGFMWLRVNLLCPENEKLLPHVWHISRLASRMRMPTRTPSQISMCCRRLRIAGSNAFIVQPSRLSIFQHMFHTLCNNHCIPEFKTLSPKIQEPHRFF
jgi:hypothetical protein